MGTKIPITVLDRFYVPAEHVDPVRLEKLYHHMLFDDRACAKCPYLDQRPSSECLGGGQDGASCENLKSNLVMWNEKEIEGEPHIGLPVGNKAQLKKLFRDKPLKLIDKRSDGKELDPKIKFNWEFLYPYQKKAVKRLLKKGYGILKSAPRTGKTVMGAAAIIYLGKKALILVHQMDLAKQFLETFHMTDPMLTNIPALEEKGRQRVGIAKKFEEFQKFDICIATYQTFLSDGGKKLLRKISRMFGTVIVDECHKTGAKEYSRVLNSFQARHRFGLSGTPDRKDGRHLLGRYTLGPIVYETEIETLAPRVEVVETPFKSKRNYSNWQNANKAIANDGPRTKQFVLDAVKLIKQGRFVLIPVAFVHQARAVRDAINRLVGKDVAIEFTGKQSKDQRRKVILDARAGKKIKCVVSMRQLLTGVNVPRWDFLLEVMPMNNAPNFQQEYNRVCTPMPGKPQPVVRFYIDEFGISMSCVVNMYDELVKLNIERVNKKYTQLQFDLKGEQLIGKYRQLKRSANKFRAAKAGGYDQGARSGPARWRARY
jgi:superfamily II DNA or RNA helicase